MESKLFCELLSSAVKLKEIDKIMLLVSDLNSDILRMADPKISIVIPEQDKEVDQVVYSVPLRSISSDEWVTNAVFQAFMRDELSEKDFIAAFDGIGYTIKLFQAKQLVENVSSHTLKIVNSLVGFDPRVVNAVLSTAIEIGREGREGKTVGAIMVIGNGRELNKYSFQMANNPFKGDVNVLDYNSRELLKEFSLLDGAYIINMRGDVLAAGRYLKVSPEPEEVVKGLGTRHISAASITKETDSIAVTVSESGGVVRVFRQGKIIYETDSKEGKKEGNPAT